MFKKYFYFVIVVAVFTACSSIPNWYEEPPQDANNLYSAKTAVSSDMQVALDKATMEARAEIARQLETKITEIQKKFVEEIGQTTDKKLNKQFSKATKSVVNTMLHGSRVKEQKFFKEDKHWRAYVLVELPWNNARKKFVENIMNDKIIYDKVKDTKLFDELLNQTKSH